MDHQARNTTKNLVTILGSGTSTGVPIITCNCAVCRSDNPKDKRLRMSIFMQTANNKNILVDCSPDMRSQLLHHQIKHLDAVIITHAHADHIHGIDDLRAFTYHRKTPLKLYTNQETADVLKEKFAYIFDPFKVFKDGKAPGGEVAKLEFSILKPNQINIIEGEEFYISELPHGIMNTISFIHQSFAYLTDGHEIPDNYLKYLQKDKLELLLLDCAAINPHKTHMHYSESLRYAHEIAARRTGLIHISHAHSHKQLEEEFSSQLGQKGFVAYDHQKLEY